MKTKLFLGCTAALATTAAQAVYLNPHGTGEALVYPYYTVNGGNSTLLSIVNTDSSAKAVKVHFLEAFNGRDVFDFNVYLSPYDTWVAQIIPKDGGAAIFTNDNSCTVPQIPATAAGASVFSTAAFDGTTSLLTDTGPTDISRTLEGSIEIIEMGTVTNGTHGTLDAITQTNGIPANCEQITTAWDGYWKTNAQADMSSASGGLFGSGTILNVQRGTVEMYSADAIAQFYTPGTPPMHSAVDSLTPNLSSGTSLTSVTFANDTPVTTSFAKAIDAVSSIFMADEITNEYWTSTSIDASSEWVLMYPTKRFYTDPYYADDRASYAPFDNKFGFDASEGTSCSTIDEEYLSREAQSTAPDIVMLPPGGSGPHPACYSTQVFTFGQPSAGPSRVLSSALDIPVVPYFGYPDQPLRYQNGWAFFDFTRIAGSASIAAHQLVGANGNTFYGQPVTGFWVTQFVNGNVGGVLSNYTALSPHKVHVRCDQGDATVPCS